MLTEQAQRALTLLQCRAKRHCEMYELERIDRASDEVIRLNGTSPAPFQVRSALAHSGTVLRERRALVPVTPLSEIRAHQEPSCLEDDFATVELREWLQTTPTFTHEERILVQMLTIDPDIAVLAAAFNISPCRMRERISRLRARARRAYARTTTS
ncbi:hypothetical protein GTZ85_12755 [Streptomyces sp. SID5474]|nr:hypothetical protein [Streptomyces sp. SID5474]